MIVLCCVLWVCDFAARWDEIKLYIVSTFLTHGVCAPEHEASVNDAVDVWRDVMPASVVVRGLELEGHLAPPGPPPIDALQ